MATICAQAADISGIVVDKANQEPLIGATVMAGDKGTTTDIDGKFAIKGITTKNIHLIIKYIGYKTAELNIATASAKDIKVEMEADEQQFGEVTVTAMANKNSAYVAIIRKRATMIGMLEIAEASGIIPVAS